MQSRVFTCVAMVVLNGGGGALAEGVRPADAFSGIEPGRPAFSLKTTTVTPSRGDATVFESPFIVDVVTEQQIENRFYRTFPQALRDVPGVMVQETGPGQGSPFIRGFTGMRTLLLIDGVRLNNSLFREGPNQYWATVDPLSIARIEVVKGPSSVLYGSDAIGGTVNAITRSPYAYGDERVSVAGSTSLRLSSAERSVGGRGEVSLGFEDRFGVVAGLGGSHFDNMEGGDDVGTQHNTAYTNWNTDFKAEYFLGDNQRLVAAYQRFAINNAPRTHRTFDAVFWEGTGPPGTGGSSGSPNRQEDYDQLRELVYVQYHATELDDVVDAVSLSLSYHRQNEVRDRIRGSGARDLQGFDVQTLGLFATLTSDSPLGAWTYGFDYYHDIVSTFSSTNPIQGAFGDDASYDLLGVFIQNEHEWTDRLTSVVGGRFTYAAVEADSVDDGNGNRIAIDNDFAAAVGSAKLVYEIVPESLAAFGGVSQGFRAPNLADLTESGVFGSGNTSVASPNLDSEEYINYEFGLKLNTDNVAVQAAYFFTDIREQIVRVRRAPASTEFDRVNGGEGFVNGVEFGASYRFHEQWTLFGNVVWMEGEIDQPTVLGGPVQTTYISRVQPITGLVGVRYDAPSGKFWFEALSRMADKADKLAPSDVTDNRIPPGGTPGYIVFDVQAGWRVLDNVELTAAVQNILDEDYRVHGSGYNMPGRNFLLSVEVVF